MQTVKVLSKGQITLPKKLRDKMKLKDGDVLLVEEKKGVLTLRKGKTVLDLMGTLPAPKTPIDEMIDQATVRAINDRV